MITIIACVDNDWGLGKDNDLLVRIPQDMDHFREVTTGSTCVFGRKTAESLPGGKPLSNRRNILLTSDLKNSIDGFENTTDVQSLLLLGSMEDIFICGGSDIYDLFMPHADKVILTALTKSFDADVKFPHESFLNWLRDSSDIDMKYINAGKHDDFEFSTIEYTKEENEIE